MQQRNSSLSYLLYLLLVPFSGTAQNYTIKESATIVPDFLHEFFQIGPDQYLAMNFSAPHGAFSAKRDDWNTIATLYDKNLRQESSGPVKELAGKKYEATFEFSHRIQLFYSDAQRVLYSCEFDGAKRALVGTPEELFTIPNEYASFIKGFSADSAYSYLLCKSFEKKGKDEAYNGVVLDRQMHMVTKFSFALEGLREYIASTACVLSNQGLLHVITAVRVKSSKSDFRPLQYIISEVNNEGKSVSTQLDNLPEGLLAGMIWSAGENGLTYTGLCAKTKKIGFTSIVTGQYHSWSKKVSDIVETEFNKTAFFQNASAKYLKEIAKDGIPPEANLAGTYVLSDQSIMLIFEKSEIIYTSGEFSYSDTRTGNLYIVKLNPKKELDWVEVIGKNQQEPSNPVFTGFISMPDGKDGLYIFYHDDARNEKLESGDKAANALLGGDWRHLSLAAIHIGKDGSFSKKFIVDDYRADLLLAPARPFTAYANEVIYTSYNLKNVGRSTYRIGKIKIN